MGMMDKLMGDPDEGKDPSEFKEPLSVEDFLSMVSKKSGKPATQAQQDDSNQTAVQSSH